MLLRVIALLLVAAAPLTAQEPGADSATPGVQGYAPGGPPAPTPTASERAMADPSVVAGAIALPMRSRAELQQAVMATQDELRRADARLSTAGESGSKARALVQQRRLDLREIEAKRKQADKEKREADKRLLEAEKRSGERQKRWAEQLEVMCDTELEAAREARQVAVAKHQALELELQLEEKRSSVPRSKPPSGGGSNVVIRELEQQTLEAQRNYRRLEHELAEKEEDLANKRLDLYRASLEAK